MQTCDYGSALEIIQEGGRVARSGWNGKGMFLFLVKGESVTEVINDCYGDPNRYDVSHTGYEKGGPSLPVLDAIYMKTADNKMVPWLASQTDLLCSDWVKLQYCKSNLNQIFSKLIYTRH